YQEVDPSQRLVAGTLERRWNDALLQLEDLKKQAAEFLRQEARVATPEQKAKVLALARDLPRVWHAPTTQAKDRKRMLRLYIKDITVQTPPRPKQILAPIPGQGGACTDISVGSARVDLGFSGSEVSFAGAKAPYDSSSLLTIFRVPRRLGRDEEAADVAVSGTR